MLDNAPVLVCLDTNVYSRPFDDQTQKSIQAEANAFLKIVAGVKNDVIRLLGSGILRFEVNEILDDEKRTKISSYLELCREHIASSEEVVTLGKMIQKECHIRARDALHIASAIIGNARYFLSCDNAVTQKKRAKCYRRIAKSDKGYFSVMNPTIFAKNLDKGEL